MCAVRVEAGVVVGSNPKPFCVSLLTHFHSRRLYFFYFILFLHSTQELSKVEVAAPGSPSIISLIISVDVKLQ